MKIPPKTANAVKMPPKQRCTKLQLAKFKQVAIYIRDPLSVTASANNTTTSNISDSKYDGKTYPVSIKIQVVKGHNYTFSISGTAIVRGNIGGTSSGYNAEVHASLSITSQSNIKLLYTDMCAYLCVDGMSVAANSELKFDVMKSGTNLKVLAQGLPTSATNLTTGQLYNLNGTLKIK